MTADTRATTEREVAQLLIDALHLEVAPQEIRPDEPLFGEGLGLIDRCAGNRAGHIAHLRRRTEVRR